MTSQQLFEEIRQTPTLQEKQKLLDSWRASQPLSEDFLSELRNKLRAEADATLHKNLEQSEQLAEILLYLAEIVEDNEIRALGLRVRGNVYCIGEKDFQLGLDDYTEAEGIYQILGMPDQEAATQPGIVVALAHLDRYEEAIARCEKATKILEKHGEWLRLGNLIMNLGNNVYGRRDKDHEALEKFDEAEGYFRNIEDNSLRESCLVWVSQNRAFTLRNLGYFEESIEITQKNIDKLCELGQPLEAARAKHILAVTYIILGHYSKAIGLLDEARHDFSKDSIEDNTALHAHDIGLIERDRVRCLIHLRRFDDALNRCQQMRNFFNQRNVMLELAQVMIYEGIIYSHLGQYEKALAFLSEAETIFSQKSSLYWQTFTRLETAKVYHQQKNYILCLETAQSCAAQFKMDGRLMEEAEASLLGTRAALRLARLEPAKQMLEHATAIVQEKNIYPLIYQCHHLAGRLEKMAGTNNFRKVEAHWKQAIEALESLRGQMMAEFRSDFLSDKESIYADMVLLYLEQRQPAKSLEYAEKAKSRVLLDLLTNRINSGVRERDPAHADLVHELNELIQQRNQIYYRWIRQQQNQGAKSRIIDRIKPPNASSRIGQETPEVLIEVEEKITEKWLKLRGLDTHYEVDEALWQAKADSIETIQFYLADKTILLEYYIAYDEILLFVVTHNQVTAHRLRITLEDIQEQLEWFRVSLETTPQFSSNEIDHLIDFVQSPLQELYDSLIAPVSKQIAECKHLYIVPHSSLHYLPFHALHDGSQYMIESHQISYLPNASFLRYCQPSSSSANQRYIFAHTSQGYLHHVIEEAQDIARLLQADFYQDDQATIEQVRQRAYNAYILHMATHGDFRADNPLFSGLVLDDGILTTLDIFDLPLQNTSLVTLSACQTGLSVIGGGDELLGLTRAFLSAGVPSLVLSMWAVDDCSTAQFMRIFYKHLLNGKGKAESLRQAQLALLNGTNTAYYHPYYWAPFFLMGDEKALPHLKLPKVNT